MPAPRKQMKVSADAWPTVEAALVLSGVTIVDAGNSVGHMDRVITIESPLLRGIDSPTVALRMRRSESSFGANGRLVDIGFAAE